MTAVHVSHSMRTIAVLPFVLINSASENAAHFGARHFMQ
jgi:hypothetical protein